MAKHDESDGYEHFDDGPDFNSTFKPGPKPLYTLYPYVWCEDPGALIKKWVGTVIEHRREQGLQNARLVVRVQMTKGRGSGAASEPVNESMLGYEGGVFKLIEQAKLNFEDEDIRKLPIKALYLSFGTAKQRSRNSSGPVGAGPDHKDTQMSTIPPLTSAPANAKPIRELSTLVDVDPCEPLQDLAHRYGIDLFEADKIRNNKRHKEVA